jgi:hypothetical protein
VLGTFTNYGTVQTQGGQFDVKPTGAVGPDSPEGVVYNYGALNERGSTGDGGLFVNEAGGTVMIGPGNTAGLTVQAGVIEGGCCSGTPYRGTFVNYGSINNKAFLGIQGTLVNYGTVGNNGNMGVSSGGTFNNHVTFHNQMTTRNSGTIDNFAGANIVNNQGQIFDLCGSVFINSGKLVGNLPMFACTTGWQYGWDEFSGPLNLVQSSVSWQSSTRGRLTISFNLVGASPNTKYLVGIALFYGSQGQCTSSFGQFSLGPCDYVTVQGHTTWEDDTNCPGAGCAPQSSPGIGTLNTDGSGNGAVSISIIGIAPGTYSLEAYIGSGPGTGINFQSPGPFGNVVSVTIF